MLEYWLWLAHRPGLNENKKLALLEQLGSPEHIYYAEEAEYCTVEGITSAMLETLRDKNLEEYRLALDVCAAKQIQILTYADAAYPRRLKAIYNPPLVLYYKGTLPDFDELPVVGIVGTRRSSAYGQAAAAKLGTEITRCGGLVVSGLAKGIDRAATKGAVSEGGCAVGVLGCGADVVYPTANKDLYEILTRQGCLLSEFMPGTEPLRWNFPRRNRIISGLSCAVVVVEAPEKSGALITARCALEQGRDVFAVPGNINLPSFSGSNQLLQDGAGTVSCGWDVLREYQSRFPDKIRKDSHPLPHAELQEESPTAPKSAEEKPRAARKKPVKEKKVIDNGKAAPYSDSAQPRRGLTGEETAVVNAIGAGERLIDDVIDECGFTTPKMIAIMTMLEMKGIIQRLPGKRIKLRSK